MEDTVLLGDRVEHLLSTLGGKQIARAIEQITKHPCKCAQRKAVLNRLHQRLLDMTHNTKEGHGFTN